MAQVTIFDILRAGSVVDALVAGPWHWIRVGGIFGLLLVATGLAAIGFAVLRKRRGLILGCAALAAALGVGGVFAGAASSLQVVRILKYPTPKDMEVGGTESFEIGILGAGVAALALLAAIGKPAPRLSEAR